MDDTATRLLRAVIRLGATRAERARALGITTRALAAWENGRIPQIIIRLEQQGIIRVLDDPLRQPTEPVAEQRTDEGL